MLSTVYYQLEWARHNTCNGVVKPMKNFTMRL